MTGPVKRQGTAAVRPPTSAPIDTLREMALVADGERGAVLGPHGSVEWLCVPRWHDEPVFGHLIGGAGEFTITPTDPWTAAGGRYEEGSLIWHTRWVGNHAVSECQDALAQPADRNHVVFLRRMRGVTGSSTMRITLAPVTGFGGEAIPLMRDGDIWSGSAGGLSIRVSGLGDGDDPAAASPQWTVDLAEGDCYDVVLEIARGDLPDESAQPQACWDATRAAWQDIVPDLPERVHCQGELRQSYAVLAGLTSSDHGMVAAATMSLPERARQGRNYDYRYAWIRDQCYVGQALAGLGRHRLLDSALTFVSDRLIADGPDLKPAYTVDGGPVPDERHVGLPGYPGGGDIAGNWVNGQFQLDALGEALSMFAAAAPLDVLGDRQWQAVRVCVDVIEQKWQEPDAGIWELDDDVYTHSRLACVAGLRAIAPHTDPAEARLWTDLAAQILDHTATTSVAETGYWQQSPTQARVDASLLRPLTQDLRADDPRSRATLEAVLRDLTIDGHVYRFRQDDGHLWAAEGSFTLCGFMVAQALQAVGNVPRAVHFFERARAACTNSGLFTEEYDTTQHQLRGNLPQAFVHAIFLETATALGDSI